MEPDQATPSDQSLAQRVLTEQDERAFRTLYRRHTPYLYQFALRLLGGNELDAEDVVQETWIRAVEKLGQFRWESSLRTWLAGITLNGCRGLFRRRDRQWLDIREHLPTLGIPGNPGSAIDLEAAIARLPDGRRTVFVLHDVEGYKHDEIAAHLGISAGTSKSQLSHARRSLREQLSGDAAAGLKDHA